MPDPAAMQSFMNFTANLVPFSTNRVHELVSDMGALYNFPPQKRQF